MSMGQNSSIESIKSRILNLKLRKMDIRKEREKEIQRLSGLSGEMITRKPVKNFVISEENDKNNINSNHFNQCDFYSFSKKLTENLKEEKKDSQSHSQLILSYKEKNQKHHHKNNTHNSKHEINSSENSFQPLSERGNCRYQANCYSKKNYPSEEKGILKKEKPKERKEPGSKSSPKRKKESNFSSQHSEDILKRRTEKKKSRENNTSGYCSFNQISLRKTQRGNKRLLNSFIQLNKRKNLFFDKIIEKKFEDTDEKTEKERLPEIKRNSQKKESEKIEESVKQPKVLNHLKKEPEVHRKFKRTEPIVKVFLSASREVEETILPEKKKVQPEEKTSEQSHIMSLIEARRRNSLKGLNKVNKRLVYPHKPEPKKSYVLLPGNRVISVGSFDSDDDSIENYRERGALSYRRENKKIEHRPSKKKKHHIRKREKKEQSINKSLPLENSLHYNYCNHQRCPCCCCHIVKESIPRMKKSNSCIVEYYPKKLKVSDDSLSNSQYSDKIENPYRNYILRPKEDNIYSERKISATKEINEKDKENNFKIIGYYDNNEKYSSDVSNDYNAKNSIY